MKQFWIICVVCVLWAGATLATPLSVDGFARDKVVFDVGAAFGRDAAQIPVSGLAPPGAQIKLRTVNARTDAKSPWQRAGVADAKGRWQAVVSVPARSDWQRIEVQAGDTRAQSDMAFGTGDVVGILGQSELARLWSDYHSRLEPVPAPIVNTDQVQFTILNNRGKLAHLFAGDQTTHAMNALAAFWVANAPAGRKLHIVDLAQSGSARVHLQNDADPKRKWSDLERVVAAAGTPIGLILESWFAGDRGTGLKWAEQFMPFYTGTYKGARDFRRGSADTKGVPVDHFLWDVSGGGEGLFEVGQTALGIFGPHRFDSKFTLTGATLRKNGKPEHALRMIERARKGIATFLAQDQLRGIVIRSALPQPMDYANGYVDPSTGKLRDTSHPSVKTPDGAQRLAKHVANAALYALGHLSYRLPQIDRISWTADRVELSSSAGPITTARQVRGLPALGTDHAHWTDVLGFEINGQAATRAELTPQGRVRLYPNTTRKFRAGDVIAFGMGGGGGGMRPIPDWQAGAYLNIPIVDVGVTGLEGVAIKVGVEFILGQ